MGLRRIFHGKARKNPHVSSRKSIQNMKKKVNKQQHVQLGGMAFYDESKCFLFAPNEHGGGEKVQGFRSQAELIRKLAHGRLSKNKDGAIQLTLKVFCDEGINIGSTLVKEAEEAADALIEYQLKR